MPPACPPPTTCSEEQRIRSGGGKVSRLGPVARLVPGNIAVSRSLGDYILKAHMGAGRVLIPDPEVSAAAPPPP